MSDRFTELGETITAVAGKWTALAGIGSFLLYLFGYLALRFQLSTYGVATSLSAIDERYLFAGSRFFVYLVSSLPSLLLIAIVLFAVLYLPTKLILTACRRWLTPFSEWWSPTRVLALGTLLSVAFIQFVFRKCFVYGNLLLLEELPQGEWMNSVLLTDDSYRALYFAGLVGATLLSAAFLFLAGPAAADEPAKPRALRRLLMFLITVQVLLLPINYGVLIASQSLPRVSEISADVPLTKGARAWLVWEASDSLIYLVSKPDEGRAIIGIPKKDSRTRIVAHDFIFQELFRRRDQTPPTPSGGGD
jgi:hypothetical protein